MEENTAMDKKTALLVIDMQMTFFGAELVYEAERLVGNVSRLIDQARKGGVPVIFIQHCADEEGDPLQPGLPTWELHPQITPLPGERVVYKHHPDAFQDTELQAVLDELGIKELVVTGIQTDVCVNSTCRRAHELGYTVTLVEDGHSTTSEPLSEAAQIIAHHNMVLGDWFVRLRPAASIKFPVAARV